MKKPQKIMNSQLNCESCGKPFECGAKTGNCWCFEVDLDPEKLAKLRKEFESCLCRECLLTHEQTQKDPKIWY
jgi:hypothetical protein